MSHLDDDVFGRLEWSEDGTYCKGTVVFLGLSMPLAIELDTFEATEAERHDAVVKSKIVFQQLDHEWENKSKIAAAKEVLEAVYCQSEDDATPEYLEKLLADMSLSLLYFVYSCDEEHAFPLLNYDALNCFPDMGIQIQFTPELSIDEVTLNS